MKVLEKFKRINYDNMGEYARSILRDIKYYTESEREAALLAKKITE